ncbi:hypothetical protein PBAL39_23327 [Pedobacter sp. BAL39]|uniref:hypothetical protein n=1 Tax=Pedobacter sp. BAL39 TaxID=391596 RepID=UPI000155A045|nr:hypothetical protein [Pedobacter sp. BAL39]EDM35991.1 hypothetical protein PBAL39_23327 [Pedobacter sp. BAL39]
MGAIQDKEFDQLFKDQLEHAEVSPSAGLWDHIAAELEPKRKRGLPVFWMSAAAVVVIGVMVALLMPKKDPIRLQGSADEFAAASALDISTAPVDGVQKIAAPSVVGVSSAQPKDTATYESTPLVIAPRFVAQNEKKDVHRMQPITENNRPVNKEDQFDPGKVDVNKQVAKVSESNVSDVVMANVDTDAPRYGNEIRESDVSESRGIKNVGDLVNYVVDKVDKREKKFLKFNTDDDDNSSLVAINIGFIKLNSRKHK